MFYRSRSIFSFVSVFTLVFLALTSLAAAQQTSDRGSRTFDRESDDIQVAPENVTLIKQYRLPASGRDTLDRKENIVDLLSPQVIDPAGVWSNVTNFAGSSIANGGAANQAGNTITRLVADDATFAGAAPYILGGFTFCVANQNTVAVSARPRVRFYSDSAGAPGTNITGFSFNPISFTANTVSCFFTQTDAVTAPTSFPTASNWIGMTFDDNTGASGATLAQMNLLGVGIYTPVDTGTSTDNIFRTTAAGSFLSNSPAGATLNFGGAPVANLGFEIRRAGTINSITRASANPPLVNTSVSWTVSTTAYTGAAVAANFALAGTAATGSTITSVTANNFAPDTTSYTVTALVGPNAGTLGLNWANTTNLNNALTNTLPFAGEVYNVVLVPTAANVDVSGRVLTNDGRGLRNAVVAIRDQNGVTRTTLTGPLGSFNFSDVESGQTYVVSVMSRRFSFSPRVVQISDNLSGLDFIAGQ